MSRHAFCAAALLALACSTSDDAGSPGAQPSDGGSGAGGAAATGGTSGSSGSATGGASGGGGGGQGANGSPSGGAGGSAGSTAGGTPGSGGSSGASGASGSSGAGGANGGGAGGSNGGSSGAGGSAGATTTGFVYVGSGDYSGPNGAVTFYRFDYQTTTLSQVDRVPVGGLASFMAIDASSFRLFVADEADGNLRLLALNPSSGAPSHATPSSTPTAGHPVHVTTTHDGKWVLVAHYNEGKAESFGVQNGSLTASLDVESPGSQAHEVVLSPDERFAFVPCKGSDRIARFSFDGSSGTLTPLAPPVTTQTGDGPRHMAFHPTGKFAYVVTELSSSVIAYTYSADGSFTELMRTTALPSGFSGTSTGAEIAVDPSGRFLYASNRITGANGDIVAFGINTADGRISLIGHQSTGGRTPRSFSLDATGRFLFVGNQGSNTVAVMPIDTTTGELGPANTTDVGVSPYFVGAAPFTQ